MTQLTLGQNGLENITHEAMAFLREIARIKGEDNVSTIRAEPFPFPSIGTFFKRVTYETSGKSYTFFIKRFDPEVYFGNPKKPGVWRRAKMRLPPAELENIYLQLFKKQGCAVPASTAIDKLTLAMEDCGTKSLEQELNGKIPDEQERILAGLIPEQVRFSLAERKIRVPSAAKDRVELYSDLYRDSVLLYKCWRPGASNEEMDSFLKRSSFFRKFDQKQYFLGDNSTFHILFNAEGKPRWIDLERLKKGHPSREHAGLLFSPETRLKFDAIERLQFSFKTQENEELQKEGLASKPLSEEDWHNYLKEFYKGVMVECFRRGTRIRELEIHRSPIYEAFIKVNPGFEDSFSTYVSSIHRIIDRAKSNGLYTQAEKSEFESAGNSILEVMST